MPWKKVAVQKSGKLNGTPWNSKEPLVLLDVWVKQTFFRCKDLESSIYKQSMDYSGSGTQWSGRDEINPLEGNIYICTWYISGKYYILRIG